MITRITGDRKRPKFQVYDLEWIPHKMILRMCGVYDGEDYRWYTTIDQFIRGELTHQRRGWWFYAHAGGLADFQFVVERLSALGFYVHGSTSGSSAIIVHVSRAVWCPKRKKMVAGKDRWHFVDSYWLLKDSLRNIGKWLGVQKGNEDESVEWYETAPWAELRDYNEQDCRILYGGIQMFEDTLYEMGGQLRMTQASCAMDLFRRKFLSRDIETSMAVNDVARNAYFASRVEVYATECEEAYYYDVNSSFPYAMTHPMPGELEGNRRRLPDWGGPYLADCEVEIPETYLPPLPRRMGGRLFFPVGRWRNWYSNIDLQVLEKAGGRILRCYESLTFHENMDLKAYSQELYERRRKSEGFPRIAYKYLLNSLYGKFGESDLKSEIIVNPPEVMPEWTMTSPGIFVHEKVVEVPHMHVPISVQVTAIARRTLYDYMGWSGELHYCDTDGFSTTSTYKDGDGLGALKLEKYIKKGRFIQAKVYDLEGTDAGGKPLSTPGDKSSVGHLTKAKGFARMTLEKFEKLLNHEEIEYTRMARIKENARKGDFKPRETILTKGIHHDAIGKRFFYPDGQSRPWLVEELEEAL